MSKQKKRKPTGQQKPTGTRLHADYWKLKAAGVPSHDGSYDPDRRRNIWIEPKPGETIDYPTAVAVYIVQRHGLTYDQAVRCVLHAAAVACIVGGGDANQSDLIHYIPLAVAGKLPPVELTVPMPGDVPPVKLAA